jgi:sec-independent protein translocase protein TatB
MDFFGIGLPEIILILVLLLIVVGPQRLPEVAAQLARLIRQGRRYATQVTTQLKDELGDLTKDYEALREELRQLREEVEQQSRPLKEEVEAASSELKASATEIEKATRGEEEKPRQSPKPPSGGEG